MTTKPSPIVEEVFDRLAMMRDGKCMQDEARHVGPRLILAGGGVERMQEGMLRTASLHQKQVREYLHRLKVAGLDRTERCKIPMELPQ